MGGGTNKGGGTPEEIQKGELANQTAITQLATQEGANSQTLFNASFPGFQQSENFFTALASGDPSKIAQVIAPATQQINQSTAGAKQNIIANSPAGGEKNLALEEADVNQGAQIGKLASEGYTSAQGTLAQLAGQGVSQGQSAAGLGISGFGSAANIGSNLLSQNQQIKGSTMSAIGAGVGDATQLATAFL